MYVVKELRGSNPFPPNRFIVLYTGDGETGRRAFTMKIRLRLSTLSLVVVSALQSRLAISGK